MKCPKCHRGGLRQQVNVFVDAPADCRSLNKKGIRKKTVRINGVGWDQATWHCPHDGCGYMIRLSSRENS